MRVRVDDDVNVQFTGLAAVDIAQVETMKVGIHFKAGMSTGRLMHHDIHIEIVCIAIAQQSSGRMADDANKRILYSLYHASRHCIAIHVQPAMNRRHNEIEFGEQLVGVVETSVPADIDFGTSEDSD